MPVAIVVSPLGRLLSTKPTKYEMAEIYLGKYLIKSAINYTEQGKYFYSFTTHSVNFKFTFIQNGHSNSPWPFNMKLNASPELLSLNSNLHVICFYPINIVLHM